MWSYVIVLKNPLFTENSYAGQAEAGAGAFPVICSLFKFLLVILFKFLLIILFEFLFVFYFELLIEALKASFLAFESLKDLLVFPKSPSPSATSRRERSPGSAGSRQIVQVPASSATPLGSTDARRVLKSLCSVADFSGTPVLLDNIQAHSCLQLHDSAPC